MKLKKSVLVLMMLLACLILPMTGAEALAKPRMVKVLIGFSPAIASVDEKALENEGTIIRRKHHRIPVISAEVPERAIGLLRRLRGVSFVEKDGRVYTLSQTLPWGVDHVNADVVQTYNKGTGVKVGIIDTGIDLDHTDLAVVGDVTFVSGTTSGNDDHGHGTHVAGTVAALDNDFGVVGVAPEAELYAIKVLDSRGSGYWSDVIAGIEWAMDHSLQVINLSLGGTSGSMALEAACNVAYEAGVLIVAAAGNSGNTWGFGDRVIYPAKYDTVMAVAATDDSDERANFSSTGPEVEIAAPGINIFSTARGNTYTTKQGTSMASPHVTGVAALVVASGIDDLNGNTRINDEVRVRLQQTADDLGDIGRDRWYGYGLVDANEAAPPASNSPPTAPVVDVIPDSPKTGDDLLCSIATPSTDADGDTVTYSYAWYKDDALQGGLTGDTVISANTSEGEVWRCVVTPNDGTVDGPTGQGEVTITQVTEKTMRVVNINMVLIPLYRGWRTYAEATVTMLDTNGDPVGDAIVDGHWENAVTDTELGTTDIDGEIIFNSNYRRRPASGTIYTFVIDKVTKEGWNWTEEDSIVEGSVEVP
jgi:subtilisin family serine protease